MNLPLNGGILGHATMRCKTLHDMIAMLIKYYRMAASLAEIYLRKDSRIAYLEVHAPRALRQVPR